MNMSQVARLNVRELQVLEREVTHCRWEIAKDIWRGIPRSLRYGKDAKVQWDHLRDLIFNGGCGFSVKKMRCEITLTKSERRKHYRNARQVRWVQQLAAAFEQFGAQCTFSVFYTPLHRGRFTCYINVGFSIQPRLDFSCFKKRPSEGGRFS